MPRLKTVTPDQAQGEVKELYAGVEKKLGRVINIFQGMGNSAAALKAYLTTSAILSEGQLSPEDREVVYLAASQRNGCEYCVSAHTMISKKLGMSDDQVLAIRKSTAANPKHQALIKFVQRVMETNGFVSDAEMDAVKSAGYSDGQIAETIAYIGLATYSNLFNHVYGTQLDFPAAPKV